MGNIHSVGPDKALFVTGGCGQSSRSVVIGDWAWAWWFVSDVQKLSLKIMTLKPQCEEVETAQGVPLTVTGVAQVKIMRKEKFLNSFLAVQKTTSSLPSNKLCLVISEQYWAL